MCDRVCLSELIENSEEGNRKIVDGVIKVGSIAFQWIPLSSLVSPLYTEPQKANVKSPAPKHEQQYIIYMSFRLFCWHASSFWNDNLINFIARANKYTRKLS